MYIFKRINIYRKIKQEVSAGRGTREREREKSEGERGNTVRD